MIRRAASRGSVLVHVFRACEDVYEARSRRVRPACQSCPYHLDGDGLDRKSFQRPEKCHRISVGAPDGRPLARCLDIELLEHLHGEREIRRVQDHSGPGRLASFPRAWCSARRGGRWCQRSASRSCTASRLSRSPAANPGYSDRKRAITACCRVASWPKEGSSSVKRERTCRTSAETFEPACAAQIRARR